MHQPEEQKKYFETAYRTGSDLWSHIPYHDIALGMLPALDRDTIVLDIGSGRGIWAFKLAEIGLRVLGVDYIPHIVEKTNQEIKSRNLFERIRFITGDATDIPFTDQSFQLVTDIGVLQHLDHVQWETYAQEINRVLQPAGYYLNVSLSKETARFLGFTPKTSAESHFHKFGVSYYFFTQQEINDLFTPYGFTITQQTIHSFSPKSDPGDSITLLFTLFQK